MDKQQDFRRFLEWANREGFDVANTYDSERSTYVCLSPETANLWKAWTQSKYTPTSKTVSEVIEELEALLCDPEGKAAIHGSEGDMKALDAALDRLRGYQQPQAAQPAPSNELAVRAIEELVQLGYTIKDDLLYPPQSAPVATRPSERSMASLLAEQAEKNTKNG